MKKYLTLSVILRIVAAAMLFYALRKLPYSYFTFLRFAVCGACAYSAYIASTIKQPAWVFIFGIIAILFNPIFIVGLDRETWTYVDVGVGVLLLLSVFIVREKQ